MRPVILLALGLFATCAPAQIITWTTPGIGNWATPANWDLGHQPIANEVVEIANGATVLYTGGTTPQLDTVRIGPEKNTSGTMEVSAGTILANVFFVGHAGQGSLLMTGNSAISTALGFGIGFESALADGFTQLDSGSIHAGIVFYVGSTGTGEFIQNGGSVTADTHIAGSNSNSTGTLTLAAGTFDVTNSITWGNNGHADITLSGTDVTSNTLDLGPNSNGSATMLFSGGSITTGEFRVGWDGTALLNQTNGTLNANNVRLGNGSGNGTYNFTGGTINTGRVLRGTSSALIFNMTGGTLVTNEFGETLNPFDLDPSGGTIAPGGTAIGTTTVHGNLALGAAATLNLQIQAASDQMLVNGQVLLAGSLALELGKVPSPLGESFTLLVNDGADAIVGTFTGLPEGSSLTQTYNSTPYEFFITYLGGDGNDVALEFPPCPVDFTGDGVLDNGDIGAFISFFLAGDLAADVTGDGFLDNGDIGAFITLFLAGC